MKAKRNTAKMLAFLLLAVLLIVFLVRHFHIKNFHCVEPHVFYTSGQPRGMDYTRLLYKYNIATIVNVRLSSEHRELHWYNEERTWTRNNGVNYVELPISREDRNRQFPDQQTQKAFLALMADNKNLPVLVHGSSGRKRESILAAVWLLKAKNCTYEHTVEIVEKIRTKPLTKVEEEFIKSLVD